MISSKRYILGVAALALALAGCSDDDNPTGDGGNVDTTAPSVTSVTPVDQNHIDVAFNEDVQRASAENETNYVIVEQPLALRASAAPGDTLLIALASLKSDGRTVALSTFAMDAAPYQIRVTGVVDLNGNGVSTSQNRSFTGTTDEDATAPEIVYRSPGVGATNVGIAQGVIVQFSEPSLLDTADFTSAGGDVQFDVFPVGAQYVLQPYAPLEMGTVYTVTIGAHDFYGNVMANVTWSFTTTNTIDTTPPRATSSTPANLATNVGVNANISLTFSEAINPLEADVQVIPDPGDGVVAWSNSGKTVTFDPQWPLWDDLQYSIAVLPNAVRDLAGNGNTEVFVAVFSTGSTIGSGSFAGTLTGDPTSDFAGDPTGALVIAANPFPFASDEFSVFGDDVVANNDTYDIGNLHDGAYYPVAAMDTNGDDEIDPEKGDAVGAYGANLAVGDFVPDSVLVNGGNRTLNVDFPLFDPNAISGTVAYDGIHSFEYHEFGIGVFDTTAFDPQSLPDYGTFAFWPYEREWAVDELGTGLADGVYYVGAYLDANDNFQFDAGDPAGFYGGDTPIPVRIESGSDAVGVVITLEDPLTAMVSGGVAWPRPANRAPWLKQWSAAIRQHTMAQRK